MSKVPQGIVDEVKRQIYQIAFDLATDGSDFNETRAIKKLVAACIEADPDLKEIFYSVRAEAVQSAKELIDDDEFEPVGELDLP